MRLIIRLAHVCFFFFEISFLFITFCYKATRATGEIELEGVRVVPAGEFTGRPNTMGLLHRARKEFYLQAPNEEEHMEWMKLLQIAARGKKKTALPPRVSQSETTVSSAKEYA